MPPKRKNGFMVFTFEWKEKYGKHMSIGNATTEAGKIWANMSHQERSPYNEKAKNEKISARNNDKLTCTGVPLSHIENEKLQQEQNTRAMKNNIEKDVRNSLKRNELAAQKYYFVMVNYFTKTLQGGVYIPAEISICEYSLEGGLCNKYHSFINPGITIYGHTYEAQNHADTTHQLPLPPNAMGEQNLGKLYNCILHFIRPDDDGEYPPLYTNVDSMPIVESVMNFLGSDPGANNVKLKIYSIQYLFFTLKEATCEVGELEKPKSIYVTDAYFERDIFEYMVGIACAFHEARDKNNYCTLSCVTRWCYTFSEYMAGDIAVKCIPGRHLPVNTKTESLAPSTSFSDTESFVSMASESTYATNALSEHKIYYDDQKSSASIRPTMFNRNDFPDLASRKKPRQQSQMEFSAYLDKDDESEVNHWAGRSRRVPPQPDKSHFKIDVSEINNKTTDLNDIDDASSQASFGRGRVFKGSFGRELAAQKYYFVMVNYFTKTLQGGVYIPAEISICEYSLEGGLCNKYHSFINPGITIYGHTYEAQNHADTTHQLPLPPNAMGEQNLGKLYNCILHFIRPDDDGEYPPLYTNVDSMPIVESVMNFLGSDPGANNVKLKIYSIQYLFFTLKEATCEVGELEKPKSIYVTDAYFERDIFEYMVGIACAFHEARDKNNYCTLSCVTRWCYTFSEYMAGDIAVKCIPGRHLPVNTKTESLAPSTSFSDTESFVSMASESTYATNALSEHKIYYDDQKSSASIRPTMFNRNDFPDLASRKKPRQQSQMEFSAYLDKDDESEVNHWAGRSRRVPPQPDKSHFKIDVSEINNKTTDLNDIDDASSQASFGRGRVFKGSFGRELAAQKYYFVMVNYFTKTLQGGVYIPAEISICEYSLEGGLCNKYHSFINPGITIYGHTYEAQNHADTTHQLPLPPNAMGEQNLGKLYNCILHFIRPDDDGEYPPLYTNVDSMPIVESVMNFLGSDPGANNVKLKIYSIQYLFFTLKEATCEVGELEKPKSIYVTDAYFERDIFEYMVGIACAFHEARDKNNYCTLSCVTRWCYTFSEYMAGDIAVKCIPGRHLPVNTKTESLAPSTSFSDTESFVSMASESTYATNALSEHKIYYDDQKSSASIRPTMFNRNDFPDLASRKKPRQQSQMEFSAYLDKDDESEVNHWAGRSRRVPPQPDKSHFKIDVSEINNKTTDLNDIDDASSQASFGRGRVFKGSFGRGSSLFK